MISVYWLCTSAALVATTVNEFAAVGERYTEEREQTVGVRRGADPGRLESHRQVRVGLADQSHRRRRSSCRHPRAACPS